MSKETDICICNSLIVNINNKAMKKTIRFLTATSIIAGAILTIVFIAGAILTSYQSSAENEKTQDKVLEAKINPGKGRQDLSLVHQEVLAGYRQFKSEPEEKIAVQEKKENRAEFEKELKEPEQKNSDLKNNPDENKELGKDKWEAFKTEFRDDMKELGKSIKDLTIKNDK